MDTLVSFESNFYQWWQFELLYYTFSLVKQPAKLIGLVASPDDLQSPVPDVELHRTRVVSPHPTTGDVYPPLNKPASFCDFFAQKQIEDRVYLLLDPDMIFVNLFTLSLQEQKPIGEECWYMNPAAHDGCEIIKTHCRRNANLVRPVSFPVVIHECMLRQFIERWYTLTEEIRDSRKSRSLVNWVSEMWAFSIAAAENYVDFSTQRNCSYTNDQETTRPLIHYTYPTVSRSGFRWDKRGYKPWDQVEKRPSDVAKAGHLFHHILDLYIQRVNHDSSLSPFRRYYAL